MHNNHCHRATAHLQLNKQIIIIIIFFLFNHCLPCGQQQRHAFSFQTLKIMPTVRKFRYQIQIHISRRCMYFGILQTSARILFNSVAFLNFDKHSII
jgi:hypothetical protein